MGPYIERLINMTASIVSIVASVKWEPLRNFWDSLTPWGTTFFVAIAVLLFMGGKELFYKLLARKVSSFETDEVKELKEVMFQSKAADVHIEQTAQNTVCITRTIKRGRGPTVSWHPNRIDIIEKG
jgi:hypothetical protein